MQLAAGIFSASLVAAATFLLLERRSRRRSLEEAVTRHLKAEETLGTVQPKVLARLPSEVSDRPWYQQVVVSDFSAALAWPAGQRVVGLHLGSEENPPESLVVLRRCMLTQMSARASAQTCLLIGLSHTGSATTLGWQVVACA